MVALPDGDLAHVSPDAHATRLGDPRRLAAVRSSGLLGGVANPVLDRVARLAAGILGVPIALVSLVDDQRQHFPGMTGLGGWAGAARGTTLSHSFCQHVVARDATLLVSDAATHPLVQDNLAFKDLGVVAYAGVPLRTTRGENLGALCAISDAPVQWTPLQVTMLEDLAATAMAEIELRATVQALSEARKQFADVAGRDGLTGLLDRRGFMERANRHHARAERTETSLGIVVVSLDGFRQINAVHGSEAGDCALIDTAALLSTAVGPVDVVGRVGDSEFALLVPDASPEDLAALRSRIEAAVLALNAEMGREFPLAVSVGVACGSPEMPQPFAAVYLEADASMVAEKGRRAAASRAGQADVLEGVR